MAFEESEVVSLVLVGLFALPMAVLWRAARGTPARAFFAPVLFAVGGIVFTVVEGVAFWRLFDFLEHLCYALCGVSFAVVCWRFPAARRREEADRL